MDPAPSSAETSRPARVNAAQVHEAAAVVDRIGTWPLLTKLEQREPEITELVLEELTELHHRLYKMGLPARRLGRFSRRLRRLCCTLLATFRPDLAE